MGVSSQNPKLNVDADYGATMLRDGLGLAVPPIRRGVATVSIQSFEAARAAVSNPARLLVELKRIAVEQLGAVPGELFRPIEDQLHDALRIETESGNGFGVVQREDLMLLLVLRQRSAAYVMRYREQVARGFDEFYGSSMESRPDAELGLLDDSELEFHLAGERMAESIGRLYQLPLDALDRRLEMLAGALGMPPMRNPVGPPQLANAFVQMFRGADLSETLQALLVQQYEQALAKVLGELYTRLNAELANGGFLAAPAQAIKAPVARPQPAASDEDVRTDEVPKDSEAKAAATTGAARSQSMTGGVDLFRTSAQARVQHQNLRELLHGWRDAGRAPRASSDTGSTGGGQREVGISPGAGVTSSAGSGATGRFAPMSGAGMGFAGGPGAGMGPGDAGATWHGGGQAFSGDAGGGFDHQTPHAGRRELRTDELVSVVSLLQRDVYEPFELALSGKRDLNDAIREHLLDGARRLGLDLDQTCVGQYEADAIDLVGLLFESLVATHALFGDARSLFARLVMPYLRVALTDENLFVRPGHPARRLIDALALSYESNEGASPQERELLDCARRVVQKVVAEYNEDLAIFDLAATELQDLLQQQRRRAEIVERRSAETVHGRERMLQARLQAASALGQRLSGVALTATVARFLERHWQHHLVQTLARGGLGSPRAVQALAFGDALVGLDRAAERGDGGLVAEQLLAMQEGLAECLTSSGLDEAAVHEWMAGLARTAAFPDAPRKERPPPPRPQLSDDSDDTRLLRVVGGTATLDFDQAVAERMTHLRPSDWMRLIDEDGIEGSVKVAWISPLTSRLLLVNRRGMRKLVASPQQLAALVKAGRLLADADELPFDQAMRQVRDRLSATGAQAA